jgi:hypothetical protein
MLLNFLVIGAAKAAPPACTTTCERTPQIYVSERKELNFFIERTAGKRARSGATSSSSGSATRSRSVRRHPTIPSIRCSGRPRPNRQGDPDARLSYIVR